MTDTTIGLTPERVAILEQLPRYEIRSDGTIWSRTGYHGLALRQMCPHIDTFGYPRIYLMLPNGERKLFRVHRLVALAFLVRPDIPNAVVRHLDGNKQNNYIENLAWGSVADNATDAIRLGETTRGTRNWSCILAESDIPRIRQLWKDGLSLTQIAQQMKCSKGAIQAIVQGRTWKHVS